MTTETKQVDRTPVFEVKEYRKKEDEDTKKIEVQEWEVNIDVKSLEEAHQLAKLARFEVYGVQKRTPNVNGELWSNNVGERVFVSPIVLEWEERVKKQIAAAKAKQTRAARAINELPKKVTLYRDEEFLITAVMDDRSRYGSKDLSYAEYRPEIKFKGEGFGYFSDYVADGWDRKAVLGKRFAKDVYRRLHPWRYDDKRSWQEYEDEVKNMPQEMVDKYSLIVRTAVNKLREHNDKLKVLKRNLH